MDVHRSRFVPYPTSAISALAFSRCSNDGYDRPQPALKLAIGRANGNIEIWNPQEGRWVQESTLLGDGRSVDAVLWTQDPDDADVDGRTIAGQHRLFSIASSPAVTEWDLAAGRAKRQSTGNFSEVWCFAAQPRLSKGKEQGDAQDIVAGCGDGTMVLLSTAEDDLQFKRFLARTNAKRARCMCVAYQPRDRVVAGFADSVIRIYDSRNGTVVRNMSLGVGVPGAPKTALVWQLKCLPNGDIVSGDSNGEVRIWDGKSYALSQRIAGHDADCIDLVTSSDGKTLLSGSIDGKIAIYRHSIDSGRSVWSKISHRRVHSGDVKAMAAFDSPGLSVLVSGGGDVAPVVTPLRNYGKENIRFLPSLPQQPPLLSAPKARLVVSWWTKTISIWHLDKQAHTVALSEPRRPWKLVSRINLDVEHHIQAVAISRDGRLLAAATKATVKIFQLRRDAGHNNLLIRKLAVPSDLATDGARLLEFSPDGKWLLVATPENETYVARLVRHPTKPKQLQVLQEIVELDRRQRTSPTHSGFRGYDRSLTHAAFSIDSTVLVVSDMSGQLDSWVLHGKEDPSAPKVGAIAKTINDRGASQSSSDSDSSDEDADIAFYGQYWTENQAGHLLPNLAAAPLAMSFRPNRERRSQGGKPDGIADTNGLSTNGQPNSQTRSEREYRLWIMTATHEMYEFDVLAGRLSDWSRRNPTASLPPEFTKIRDRVMGAVWDVDGQHERLWLYGTSFMCMLNVGSSRQDDATLPVAHKGKKNRDETRPASAATPECEGRKRRKLESHADGSVEAFEHEGAPETVQRLEDGEGLKADTTRTEVGARSQDEIGHESVDSAIARPAGRGDEQLATCAIEAPLLQSRKWWSSARWGPVLGMVSLHDDTDGSDEALEVVLVERPRHIAEESDR